MTPDVVVDIGNTRIKWGWGDAYAPTPGMVSLPPDDEDAWDEQLTRLPNRDSYSWAIASVHPDRAARFAAWVHARGERCQVIEHAHVMLAMNVDEPHRVGIDRLLNALAARNLVHPYSASLISIGTAVTVDLLDDEEGFQGGVIFPGPRLMAESLHAHTAKLPLVDAHTLPIMAAPAKNTNDAILAGIRAAIVGGVVHLATQYAKREHAPWVVITGGAVGDLGRSDFGSLSQRTIVRPELTLEGIRIAAEALP